MADFDFVDLTEAQAQKSTGRVTNDKKQTEMDDLLRKIATQDRAVRLTPSEGETQRGLRLRIAQAIKRTNASVIAFTGRDGNVYAHKVADGAPEPEPNGKAPKATKAKGEPVAAA